MLSALCCASEPTTHISRSQKNSAPPLFVDSAKGLTVGYQIVLGVGLGMLFTSTTFPILASVKVTEAAPALALFTFVRSFAQTWGIAIGSTVLQNQLSKRLPAEVFTRFPGGADMTYSIIPLIRNLPRPLRDEIHTAFAGSLIVLWQVMVGLSGAGLLTVLAMKELPMHTTTDENFGFENRERQGDAEKAGAIGKM